MVNLQTVTEEKPEASVKKSSTPCLYNQAKMGIKAIWELTNNCNMNCVHCCNASERSINTDIDFEKAISILKDLYTAGVTKIVLGGGEPLLFHRIS